MKGKMTTLIASAVLVMSGAALLESPALSANSNNQRLTNEPQTPVLARSRRGGRGQRGVQPIEPQPVIASSQNRGGYGVESNNFVM